MTPFSPTVNFSLWLCCIGVFLLPTSVFSQQSKKKAYQVAIERSVQQGTFKGFDCSQDLVQSNRGASSRAAACSDVFDVGYGTNCWSDVNTTPDPACAVPAVPASDCNGGLYRLPIAITIFECTNWGGANYLSDDGGQTGGFQPLQDVDLTAKLIEVNELYANANIEFYEIQRRRVEDCGLYDFFTNVDPATGVNELSATAVFDVSNAINIYFVGGINRDHDCCGLMGFAPYPPSRDYTLLRYGAGVAGSNLAHELGHLFGLPHTYAESITPPVRDSEGEPVGSLDNCDCLTTGDRICDTWPDPYFSHNCNHDGGSGGACYIKADTENFCDFDEEAYRNHILTSHPGAPSELLISPNSGMTFSATSSTVLKQNIMTNNLFFGCTTTFSPCQYKKIHDVARADCRNYLCAATASDYFLSTTTNDNNTAFYEICAGDNIPTFTAGTTVTRLNGTTYSLDCFNWYVGEFDRYEEAILFNSSTYTPPISALGNNTPGVYEFWVAEANAIHDVPCKIKVSITILEDAGTAIQEGTNMAIDTCGPASLTFDAMGSTLSSNNDMIGWYFSNDNPINNLTTAASISAAINSAANANLLDASTGNIIQSTNGDPLSTLEDLVIDCNLLGAGTGTYYLTPFIANGEEITNCDQSNNSSNITWNFSGNLSNGAILNIGPIQNCAATGTLSDYSLTLNISNCSVSSGLVGVNVNFNCGPEISINSLFDRTFNCATNSLILSKDQIESLRPGFDPLTDEVCFSFIDTGVIPPDFQGDLTLTATARLEATYIGSNAKALWDASGQPSLNLNNPSCFWGTPIAINCNCTMLDCPTLGSIGGTTNLCSGSMDGDLTVSGINDIGSFGIEFVYFNTQQSGDNVYDVPDGILGTVSNNNLTNNGTQATLQNSTYPTVAGTYFVYARLSPSPSDMTCRPFLEIPVTIEAAPTAPIVFDTSYCQNATAGILTAQGSNLLWYDTAIGGTGIITAPTPSTSTTGIQEYWVSQTANGCESTRSKITVTTQALPTAPMVSDTSFCQNATARILTAEGTNLLWYNAATGGTGGIAPTPGTTITGMQEYWVSQTVNSCESTRSKITVTIQALPTAPIVSDTSFCQNAIAGILTAQGTDLLWYDTAVGGTGIITPPTPSTTTTGLQEYWVSQTVNGCESTRSKIMVTTQALPTAPIVSDTAYCQNATVSILPAQGTNLLWYDAATGGTGSTTAPTPSTSTAGLQEYWVSQTVNGCESTRARIMVTIQALLAAPIVSDTAYCQNATASILTAQGMNLLWYDMATEGTGSTTAPTPSTSTIGMQEYWVSQAVNDCESTRSKITVTIESLPTAPNVSDTSYCQNAIAGILTAQGTDLLWYDTAIGGTGMITAPTLGTSEIGIQEYWVSQTVNGCESTRSKITVTIQALPTAPIVSDTTYCQNATASIFTAQGMNLLWYDMATGGTGSTNAPAPNTATAGLQEYWVSQTVNVCESTRSRIMVTVQALPTAPIVFDTGYCQNEAAGILTAQGSNLLWYDTVVGGTGSSTALTPSTSTTGLQEYWVSQSVNGCESERAKLNITIHPAIQLQISAFTNPSTCAGSDGSIVLNGLLASTVYDLSYSNGGTPVTQRIITDDNGTFTIPNLPAGLYDEIMVENDNCSSVPLSQQLNDPSGADVSSMVANNGITTICEGDSTSLIVNITGGQTPYTIELIDGNSNTIIHDYTSGELIRVAPTQTTSYSVLAIMDDNNCTNLATEIVLDIIVNPIPDAPVVSDMSYCQNETALVLTAQGTNLLWYDTAIGGTGSTTAPTPNTSTTGIQEYWVSQMANGCESDRSKITVTIHAIPLAPMVTDTSYCQNGVATILAAPGENLLWYDMATGGTGSTSAPTPTTTSTGVQEYWVSQMVNGCESARSKIMVTIQSTLLAPIVANTNYCQNEIATILTAQGVNLLWYDTATGGTGSTTAPTPNTTTAGIQEYWVSQTVNECESPRSKITVTIQATPITPVVADTSYCQNEVAAILTAPGTNLLWFDAAIGGVGSTTAPTPNTATAGIQEYWVSQTINGCESGRAKMEIAILPASSLSIASFNNPSSCSGADGSISLGGLSDTTTYILAYQLNDSLYLDEITADTNGLFTLNNLAAGLYEGIVVSDDQCSTIAISQELNDPISAEVSSITTNDGRTTICEGDSTSLLVNITDGQAPYTIELLDGNSTTILNDYTSGQLIEVAPTQTTSYSILSIIDDNGCTNIATATAATITVNPIPEAPVTSSITLCQNAPTSALTANGENLQWYDMATGGNSLSNTPIPSTAVAGIQQYWVSQTINTCESNRTPITITIIEKPSIGIGATIDPTGGTNGSIQITGLTPNTDYVLTYKVDGVTQTISITTDGAGNYQLTNLTEGSYMISVAIGENVSNTITTVLEQETCLEIPAPPRVDHATYCVGDTPQSLQAVGQNIRWYITPTGTSGTTNPPTPTTDLSGRYQFWVSQTVDGCESERIPFVIRIKEIPEPRLGLVISPSTCGKDGSIQITSLTPTTDYLLKYDQNGFVRYKTITTTRGGTYTLRSLSSAVYELELFNNGCGSTAIRYTLNSEQTAFTGTLEGTTTICNGGFTMLDVDIQGGVAPYTVYFSDGSGHFAFQGYKSGRGIRMRPQITTDYSLVAIRDASGCYGIALPEKVTISVQNCSGK